MTRKEQREAVFGLLFEREFRLEETAEDIFALPMHPYLDKATIEKIGAIVKKAVNA